MLEVLFIFRDYFLLLKIVSQTFKSVWISNRCNILCFMRAKGTYNSLLWEQNICICKYSIINDFTVFSYVLLKRLNVRKNNIFETYWLYFNKSNNSILTALQFQIIP